MNKVNDLYTIFEYIIKFCLKNKSNKIFQQKMN